MTQRNEAVRLLLALSASFLITLFSHSCYALLIDDFSGSQVGISTDQNAAYDILHSASVFGGSRIIWGGGASIPAACQNCDIVTTVAGGNMTITPGADCPGAGNVSWDAATYANPVAVDSLSADLSNYVGLEVVISELSGITWTRFSIASGRNSGTGSYNWYRRDVFFDSVGPHIFYFSELLHSQGPTPLNLHDINNITMSTYLDLGEFVAFDSVSLVVPEPFTAALLPVAILMFVRPRSR